MKHKDLVDQLTEAIKIDVEVGDTILTGRFKNKKTKVTSIGKDDHGMPTINGRKATTFRTAPKSVNESEVKTIHDLLVKYGKNTKTAMDMIKKNYKRVAKKYRGSSPRDKAVILVGLSALGESQKRILIKKLTEQKEIKKVIGVYGGRFQPFGPHHLKTYQWLKTKVDEAYITTSNIKKPPRHPMNFKEKVRHMVKMGVSANRIVEEKSPYVAKNLLSKFGDDVAVVYIFGKKDAGRLTGGKYFQDYKSNKGNLKGHKENGYIMTAPHVDMNISGVEISGTGIRKLLGSPEFKNNREKLFKKTFGYFDKGLYNMMTNKFGKLFEFYAHLFENSNLNTAGETDDGPSMFSSLSAYMTRAELEAGRLGWELTDILTDTDSYNSQYRDYRKDTDYPNGPIDSVSFGPAGINQPSAQNLSDYVGTELWNKWLDHIDRVLSNQEYEYTDDLARARKAVVQDSPKTAKQMDDEEPKPTEERDGDDQHDELEIVKEVISLVSDLPKNGRELLLMGGAYGHMSHPFDDRDLTFGDLKKIIELGLSGQLNREDNVTEKLDGQNLMISWKNGKLITARNKGHIKNKGETALDIKGVESKFAGRGDIRNAFVFAVKDLQKAISKLSKKQKNKIFGEGSKWMNLEVMWPASENVVNYDLAEIVFHGALEYDDSGRVIGQVKDSARMLQGMIKQANQNIQKNYNIGKPNFLTVPKHQDFGKMKKKFNGKLQSLQNQYALTDSDTFALYHQRYWEEYIYNASKQFNYKIPNNILVKLTKRWAFFDKSYKIPQIKKDLKKKPTFLDWVLTTDKVDHQKMVKDNMKPFEELFFEVGVEIMKNVEGWLAVNPAKSVQSIRQKLKTAIASVKSGGDLKKLNTLKLQLDKLNAIGGLDAVVPSEGIVFKYKGNTYKFTGAFAPINQITGLMAF